MRILLDECVPASLRRELPHEVYTVGQRGWSGIKNGALLRLMLDAGFDALLTLDQNLAYQQNLANSGIAVVVLVAIPNKRDDLLPLIPAVNAALSKVKSGEVVVINKSSPGGVVSMKAAYIHETGPAENIQYGDLPKPTATGSLVLVKTAAVAVNPIDTYLRGGANYWELPKPFIIGCDLAGSVEAVGEKVTRFKPGDRVWCSNQGLLGRQGTFAEYCAVDECWLYPTPQGVNDETAAASALVGITAHLGLFREANLKSGQTIFVNGGTGGVGSMVVQMAKAAGARMIATAGSAEKCAALKQLGADVAVNYKTDDIAAAVKQFAPGGVNVYWETVREPDFDKIVSYLAERGRMILMAGRDARPAFPVGPFYVKGCSLHGFVMFKATADEQRACADDINRWLASGKLKANISAVMPLAKSAEAHSLQEANTLQKAGTIAGKIVLKP